MNHTRKQALDFGVLTWRQQLPQLVLLQIVKQIFQ